MRLAICDYSGHPFQVELSRCLAARGHPTLHLHFAEFQTPKGALTRLPGDSANFHVEGICLGRPFDKRKFLRRRFLEAEIGQRIAMRAAAFEADVVIGCNMPLDAQRNLQRFCGRRAGFIFWLQDIYSRAIDHYLRARLGPLGAAIGAYYGHLEAELLRSSDAVIAISEKFVAPLLRWGVEPRKIRVVPNWAPLSEIYPADKDNEWARAHGLHDKCVALYSGTLGLKHDPALLLETALAGRAHGVHMAVVSEGAGVDWLTEKRQELGIDNLTLMPFQPMERYREVLGAGDILLAMVGEEAAGFSVPSKILSYLAAGKPIVASIAGNNDAAAAIREAAAGFVVAPQDRRSFIARIGELAADPALRAALGRNARGFAESRFDIARIADRFEDILGSLSLAAGRPARVSRWRGAAATHR